MNILLLNKTYFLDELRAQGHHVITAAPASSFSLRTTELTSGRTFNLPFAENTTLSDLLNKLPAGITIERIIYCDDSHPSLHLQGLGDSDIPSVFLSVDAHIHTRWHPILSGAFDLALVAQKDYLPLFSAFAPRAEWFPLWAAKFLEPSAHKDIEVCFRGSLDPRTHPERARFVQTLSGLVPIDSRWEDYSLAYPRSKIVLNAPMKADLNFRVFETLMSGALLVTPRTANGLLELFKDREHLVTFEDGNAVDAANKIRYFLEHEEERARIAAAGRAEVLARHTALQRGSALQHLLESLTRTVRPNRGPAEAAQALLETALTLGKLQSADQSLQRCVLALEARSAQKLPWREAELATFLMCYQLLGQRHMPALQQSLSANLFAASPDQQTFLLALIGSLIRQGKGEQALKTAAAFSQMPENLLSEAERFSAQIADSAQQLSRVLSSLKID